MEKFRALKNIFKSKFNCKNKIEIFNLCVTPTLVYGSQTWVMTKETEKKITNTQNAMETSMLNLKQKDRVRIKDIRDKLPGRKNLLETIRKLYWDWAGHVMRLKDDRWTYPTTFWFLKYKKRRIGRPKKRWEDDILTFLQAGRFHQVAFNRKEWNPLLMTFAYQGPGVLSL